MINIDNTHIYKGISFSPFRLSSTNYKLGITPHIKLVHLSQTGVQKIVLLAMSCSINANNFGSQLKGL
jgi:hypothetical protein